MSANQFPAPPRPPAGEPKPKQNRTLWIVIGVGGGLLLLCLCAIAIGAFVYFDPLGLLGGDVIARTMPADTSLYAAVDLRKLASEDTVRIINAFTEASDAEFEDAEDFIDQMDEDLDEQYGLTYTDDIQPWLGTQAGIALLDFELDQSGTPQADQYVIAVQVRDTEQADAFIEKFVEAMEEDYDASADDSDYEGVTIYEITASWGDSTAIARSGKILYLSTQADLIEEAIDASKGDSLADSQAFRETTSALPKNRVATLYASRETFDAVANYMGGELSLGQNALDTLEAYTGLALALSTDQNAVRLDMAATYDLDALTDEQRALLEAGRSAGNFSQYFPPDTYYFATGTHLDLVWASYDSALQDALGDSAYEDVIGVFEDELGFNLNDDLFAYLDGGWAVGVFGSDDSYYSQELDLEVDYLFVAEASDLEQIDNVAEDFAAWYEDEVGESADESSGDGGHFYELYGDSQSQVPVFAFGTRRDYLLIGGSAATLAGAFDLDDSLTSSEQYQQMARMFQGGSLTMYLDVQSLLDLIESSNNGSSDVDALRPILAAAVGGGSLKGSIVQSSLIILVDVD